MIAITRGGRLETVEAVVHEYGHQKLDAILALDPLFRGDGGEAIYYSPWKDDPRPLTGLLHAVYSFAIVLSFYCDLLCLPGAGGFDPQRSPGSTSPGTRPRTVKDPPGDHDKYQPR
jgi:HEXXH motif-containing protein